MKKVYILQTRLMNGTVTAGSTEEIFLTKELAERCKKIVIQKNQQNQDCRDKFGLTVLCDVKEATMFESEDDVECLNKTESDAN